MYRIHQQLVDPSQGYCDPGLTLIWPTGTGVPTSNTTRSSFLGVSLAQTFHLAFLERAGAFSKLHKLSIRVKSLQRFCEELCQTGTIQTNGGAVRAPATLLGIHLNTSKAGDDKETTSPRRRTKDAGILGIKEALGRERALGRTKKINEGSQYLVDERSSKVLAAASRLRTFIKVLFTMEFRPVSGGNALQKKVGR